jgi:hypothetical protein
MNRIPRGSAARCFASLLSRSRFALPRQTAATDDNLSLTSPGRKSCSRPNRSTSRRWVARIVLASFFMAFSSFCATGVAVAQETPVLVARGLPDIESWCGDHAAIFRIRAKHREDVYWLDVLTGKKAKLQYGLSTLLLECSPDSR